MWVVRSDYTRYLNQIWYIAEQSDNNHAWRNVVIMNDGGRHIEFPQNLVDRCIRVTEAIAADCGNIINQSIGDDTQAAARRSPKCSRETKKQGRTGPPRAHGETVSWGP